jgi:hypothetical protein
MNDLIVGDIYNESWREYEWESEFGVRTVRIENPITLYFRPNGSTHRVWDGNVVYCIPAPGRMGCVLKWSPKDPTRPVEF